MYPDPRGIRFKTVPGHDLADEWTRADSRLVGVLVYAAGWSLASAGVPLCVTTLERTPAEQLAIYGDGRPSPHVPQSPGAGTRAADIRVRGPEYPASYGEALAAAINAAFCQPTSRPVAIYEPPVLDSKTRLEVRGSHVHVQVSPRSTSTPGFSRATV